MEDGSYAYIATDTFPYFVGCWGPGAINSMAPSCTSNSCNGAFESF